MQIERLYEAKRRLKLYKQPYLGLAELADLFAWPSTKMYTYQKRHPDRWPEADLILRMGPIYYKPNLMAWLGKEIKGHVDYRPAV